MPRQSNHISEAFAIWAKAISGLTLPKSLVAAATSFAIWIMPPPMTSWIICGIMLLIILDFVTGVRLALKKGKFISSKLYNRIVDKGLAYGSLIVISLFLHKFSKEFGMIVINDTKISGVGVIVDGFLLLVTGGLFSSLLENLSALKVPFAGWAAKKVKIATHQYAEKFDLNTLGKDEPDKP